MKKLFTLLSVQEAPKVIRIAAKIVRIIYIILAFLSLFISFIGTIFFIAEEEPRLGLLYLLMGIIGFLITLLTAILTEALLIGFAVIVRNNYEELRIKNIDMDNEDSNSSNSDIQKLHMAKKLKDDGFISEEEYEGIKHNILEKFK